MGSPQQQPRRRPSSRPRLEQLEDRCVPSVYSVTDLGANITPINSFGQSLGFLNDNGVVAGEIFNSSGQPVDVLFQNGKLTELPLKFVTGLNNSNEVVGLNSSGPALWSDGTVTPVPIAGAIADNGTIAGGGEVDVNGTVTALSPSSAAFAALTISDNGQYVGGSSFGNQGEASAAIWNLATGQFAFAEGTSFNSLGQTSGVNNSGQAVGQYDLDSGGFAFLYANGQLMDLGQGGGSSANGINDAGAIVGTGSSGVFVYSNGVFTNLQSVLSENSGFTLTKAISINNNGQILATGTNDAGTTDTLLLTPVATPSFALSGFPTTTTAGEAHDLTVTVLNPDGSVATDYTGTVHFASSDPRAVLPADYTFTADDAGVHTFSVTLRSATGGINYNYTPTITVIDTANPGISGGQVEDAVDPGAAIRFAVFGGVQSGRKYSVVVQAYDSSGNVATGYTGTIHFTDSVDGQLLPADYTFTAADGGRHAFTVTFTPGRHTVTATDTLDDTLFGSETLNVS
jgi:hypothetical protein